MTEFLPNWAEPPGGTIKDVLRERRLSPRELAASVGRTLEELQGLLDGDVRLNTEMAAELEAELGIAAPVWLGLESQYRFDLKRVAPVPEAAAWLRNLPLAEMKRFGWLRSAAHESEVESCLRFFGVSSIPAWEERLARALSGVALRTSPTFRARDAVVFSWLRRGEILADEMEGGQWNPDGFHAAIPEMRALSRKVDPQVFLPQLQAIAAQYGVAVVVARAPTGCRASGATCLLSQDRALILLSFRYLTDDHFWFTFFHEVGHLLLHRQERTFLEGSDFPETPMEAEANEFAADVLVPRTLRTELLSLSSDHKEVMRFARQIGVAPGIVVGQLQHFGVLKRSWLNSLKRRYRWED